MKENNYIRIKVSGDGTNVGRSLHVINFTFTLVDKPTAESVTGNHTLAILKTGKDYCDLYAGFKNISQEVKELSSIRVNGKLYMIECFLGGDWKFLAIVCGLNVANAEYSCIWCKCLFGERWNTTKEWSISDTTKGARTISEIQSLSKGPARKNFGCLKMPIFSSIPIDHIIIDSLNSFVSPCS